MICDSSTAHYTTICELLKAYSTDGIVTISDSHRADTDFGNGLLTQAEADLIALVAYRTDNSVNGLCPGCYTTCTTLSCSFTMT